MKAIGGHAVDSVDFFRAHSDRARRSPEGGAPFALRQVIF